MFEPNVVGRISHLIGRDLYSRPSYSEPMDCPFGIVNMDIGAEKTSVRADSSASRGAADETSAVRAKILIVPYIKVAIGDRFEFQDLTFVISSRHERRSVMGNVDHYECDMELLPV